MSSVFQKLNLKDQKEIVVLNAPPGFQPEIASLENVKVLNSLDQIPQVDFVLTFVTFKKEVDAFSPIISKKSPRGCCGLVCLPERHIQKVQNMISIGITAGM